MAVTINDALSDENLLDAWYKVLANQGCAGIDGESLDDFNNGLQLNLDTLRDEVIHQSYRPLPLIRVAVDKKTGGKRPLSIPAVRDRVLQTAVTLVLTPLFEAEFEDCSFAYRRGRSVEQAVRRVEILRNKGYHWVVDADIERFFDAINHQQLLTEVAKLVSDPDIIKLIKQWLKATVVDGKNRFRMTKGVPQGSPISPLLSNLYLDHLDEALLDKNHYIIRFADDFLILCKSQKGAEKALQLTAEILNDLKLTISEPKTRIVDFNRGFRFLGVQFIRSLAYKSQYKESDSLDVSTHAKDSGTQLSTEVIQTTGPKTQMEMAFAEANLDAGNFPSAPESPEAIELPEKYTQVANHDPRLRTLYLLQHGSVLGKESERLVLKYQQKIILEIPAIKVDQVMVFGNAQITTQAMQFCLQERIPIYLLSGKGFFYGVIDSFTTEPVRLHRDQFLRADDACFSLKIAKQFVLGKITNSRLILTRLARRHNAPVLHQGADALKAILRQLQQAQTLEQLRGYEGIAAKYYFSTMSQMLDAGWQFTRRVRQPPTDPINALLSYGYTLLFYNIYSFLRARGLNPHVGFLHPLRAGHPALVSDIIEEFRAIVVDTVVWTLVLNNRLSRDDFLLPSAPGEACLLNPNGKKRFIKALESKLNAAIKHPNSGLKLDYRRCIEHQVQHLAAVIRGRDPDYRPMVIR